MFKFSTEAKVGILVLIGILLLGYMTLKLGQFQISKEKGMLISAMFDTASGLKKGVPVEIAGIEIGTVESISLKQGRALVTMLIRSDLDLRVDSRAIIRTAGVLGDKYIEIIPGLTGAPLLKDGDQLVRTTAPADMDQLMMKISEISDDIRQVTKSLNDVFGGTEGTANMREILNNLSEMSETLSTMISENRESLSLLIENLTAFSKDIQSISSDNKEEIKSILANLSQTSEQLAHTITAVREISEKISQGTGTLGQLINEDTVIKTLDRTLASLNEVIDKINRGEGTLGALITEGETSQNISQTMASLKDITEKINQGQGTIGRLINDETTMDRIDEALSGLNEVITKVDTIKLTVDYHSDYFFNTSKAKSYLNLRIQPREDKYYLIGLVDDPEGVYSKEITTITGPAPGASATTTTESWDQFGLKFNAQIAKRYYDLTIRAGLFESRAGFGTDYYLLDDDLRLSFEIFDFGRETDNVHLKFSASYEFLKFFYLNAGYDDFANKNRSSFFLGLGLRFTDDDLKYLLTSVPLPF